MKSVIYIAYRKTVEAGIYPTNHPTAISDIVSANHSSLLPSEPTRV
jgi:hypothetical protein